MTIEGEYLGEPATLTVDGDRKTLAYTIAAHPAACEVTTIALRHSRLGPFHLFALVFAIGAYFAKMPWLAVAFAVAAIAHAVYRIVAPSLVLVLDDKPFVVARGSRELVRRLAAP